jgi:ankyrin repeat protein
MKSKLIAIVAAVVLVGVWLLMPSPIHRAATLGDIETVKKHLAAGVDVNAKNGSGSTPLHYAAVTGQKEVVELLIAEGADVNAKSIDGGTPLDQAEAAWVKKFAAARKETAALLRKHGGKHGGKAGEYRSIHAAADRGDIEAVKQYLAAGRDVNAKDRKFGNTPLHYATGGGYTRIFALKTTDEPHYKEIAELLIAKGADVNAKDANGETPLDWAIQFTQTETADLLRKHGGKTGEELKAEGN